MTRLAAGRRGLTGSAGVSPALASAAPAGRPGRPRAQTGFASPRSLLGLALAGGAVAAELGRHVVGAVTVVAAVARRPVVGRAVPVAVGPVPVGVGIARAHAVGAGRGDAILVGGVGIAIRHVRVGVAAVRVATAAVRVAVAEPGGCAGADR